MKTLALVVAIGMVVSACGADDSGSIDTTADSPNTTATIQSTTEPPETTENSGTVSEPTSEADGIAVCPLLTAEEVGTVLDSAGEGEENATLAPLYSCTWTDTTNRELVLSVTRAPSPTEVEALFDIEVADTEDLTGLGDAARIYPDFFGGDGAQIEVIFGAYYITLVINEIDDDLALVPLLEAALTRLP